jgi:hypothetical protein
VVVHTRQHAAVNEFEPSLTNLHEILPAGKCFGRSVLIKQLSVVRDRQDRTRASIENSSEQQLRLRGRKN